MRWYHIADFDFFIGDDDTVDQQLDQTPLLLEGGVG
jgi:hypothetical protein